MLEESVEQVLQWFGNGLFELAERRSPLGTALDDGQVRDFVRDYLGRDALGVPTDAENDQWTVRLQVQL